MGERENEYWRELYEAMNELAIINWLNQVADHYEQRSQEIEFESKLTMLLQENNITYGTTENY